MNKSLAKNRIIDLLSPVSLFLLIFVVWELVTRLTNTPVWLLPSPSLIFKSMIVNFKDLWPHIAMSFGTIFLGIIIGIPIGFCFAAIVTNFQVVAVALTPYVLLMVTTPLITLVPLLMLWMGFGMKTRVVAVTIQTFAIINMNCCTGFLNTPHVRHELAQSCGASRIQTFFYVVFPSAMSDVFTGLELATIFASTTCISAEYVGGNMGLGSQIIKYSQFLKTTESFACIFYVTLIGLFFYGGVKLLKKKLVFWKI